MKNFIWVGEGGSETTIIDTKSVKDYKSLFSKYKSHGIDGVIFFANNDRWREALEVAKKLRMEFHLWKPLLVCRDKSLEVNHPSWFAVNRNGASTIEETPYVDFYKWFCPNNPEVKEYLLNIIDQLLMDSRIDSFHLDYIRYCDLFIPEGLIGKYGLKKGEYYPEYDYCYCSECCSKFEAEFGFDPRGKLNIDEKNLWNEYRLNSITRLVKSIKKFINSKGIKVSSAVFPGPSSVAEVNVKQRWSDWGIDGYFPMNYNSMYNKGVSWLKDIVKEERDAIKGLGKLFSGLYLENMTTAELKVAVYDSMRSGADGVSLYCDDLLTDKHLKAFAQVAGLCRNGI